MISSSERRLLRKTLEDIYGTGPLTPAQQLQYKTSAADRNIVNENAYSSTKGVRAGSNPNADFIEAVTSKIDPNTGLPTTVPLSPGASAEQVRLYNEALRQADIRNSVRAPSTNAANQQFYNYDPATGIRTKESDSDRMIRIAGIRATQRANNPGTTPEERQAWAEKNTPFSRTLESLETGNMDVSGSNLPPGYRDLKANPVDPNQTPTARTEQERNIAETNTELLRQQELQRKSEEERVAGGVSASSASMDLSALFPTPEGQAFAKAFQPTFDAILKNQEEAGQMAQTMLTGGTMMIGGKPVQVRGMQSAFDEVDRKIREMDTMATSIQGAVEQMLQKTKDEQDKALTAQEQSAMDRNSWEEAKVTRRLSKAKQQVVDSKVASLALRGGIDSDGGLRDIEQTGLEFERAIMDAQSEFSIQRSDIAVKYSSLHAEATNTYVTNSIANIREAAAALERNAGQSFTFIMGRANAENSILSNFMSSQMQNRKDLATNYKEMVVGIQTAIASKEAADGKQAWEEYKFAKEQEGKGGIPAKDTLDWAFKLGESVKNLASYKTFSEVGRNLSNIKTVLQMAKEGKIDKRVFDDTVIKAFSNIQNPESTIKQTQYNVSAELQPWYQKFITGGIAAAMRDTLPDDTVRAQIADLAEKIYFQQRDQLINDLQPTIMQIGQFNGQPGVQMPLNLREVLTPDIINALGIPDTEFQKAEMAMGGFSSPPAGGFRTDRNNNPLAFTTEIAKQAGLKEGVDYEVGDKFPDSNYSTARILGDPIATSIQVIDRIGFYTGKGQQRWTHTAMPQSEWQKLDYSGKRQVVANMYQKEGGSGMLVGNQVAPPSNPIASTQGQPLFSTPTAHAADYPPSTPPPPPAPSAPAAPPKVNTPSISLSAGPLTKADFERTLTQVPELKTFIQAPTAENKAAVEKKVHTFDPRMRATLQEIIYRLGFAAAQQSRGSGRAGGQFVASSWRMTKDVADLGWRMLAGVAQPFVQGIQEGFQSNL